jgi:hypothetical protein
MVGAVRLNVKLQVPPAGICAPLTANDPEVFAESVVPQADVRLLVLKPVGILSVNCTVAAVLPELLSFSVETVVELPVPTFSESDVAFVVQFAV